MKKSFLLIGCLVLIKPVYSAEYQSYDYSSINRNIRDTARTVEQVACASLACIYVGFLCYMAYQLVKDQSVQPQTDNSNQPAKWFGPLPKEVQQIFDFIEQQALYESAGINKSSNILLKGVPGTGKSHLARYIAEQFDVPFFEKSSGDFHDMFVGVGPKKMRTLFADARKAASKSNNKIGAVIFIDEIEGIAKSRDRLGNDALATEEIRLLNTLLAELTNSENKNILVICATNCPDMLDKAVKRPGRFGLHITLEPPAVENRKALFKAFLLDAFDKGNHEYFQEECYTEELYQAAAEACPGFVAADIQESVTQALTTAVQERAATTVTQEELLTAIATIKKQKNTQGQSFLEEDPSNIGDTSSDREPVEWFGPLPDEAQQIFDFVEQRDLFAQAGIKEGSNVLLQGVPGTGKSHLARYIAQELDVGFFEASSGDFHQKWIGEGPKRMRDLFIKARKAALEKECIGAIVFIDEIEGIASSRTNGKDSTGENLRLLNTLLTELTNPDNKNVLVICATNCPDLLDKAIKRTGRFGLHVTMEPPAFENRKALFEAFLTSHLRKGGAQVSHNPYTEELFVKAAAKSIGFVPSDIKEAVKRSLTKAVRNRKSTTTTEEELLEEIEQIARQKYTTNHNFLGA